MFLSWRFFVELMGLSTPEKMKILNKIEEVDYDRQRAMAAITHARKLRLVSVLFLITSLVIKKCRRRSLSQVIRNFSLPQTRKAAMYTPFLYFHILSLGHELEESRFNLANCHGFLREF